MAVTSPTYPDAAVRPSITNYADGMALAKRPTGLLLGVLVLVVVRVLKEVLTFGSGYLLLVTGIVPNTEIAQLFLILLGYVFYVVLIGAWVVRKEQRPFRSLGFGATPNRGTQIVAGVLVAGAAFAVVLAAAFVSGGVSIRMAPEGFGIGLFGAALLLLLGYTIQGSGEEVVFRGYALQLFRRPLGLVGAIGAQGILFVLSHVLGGPVNGVAYLNILLIAVFLGVWSVASNGVWGACAFHATWNWLMGTVFGGSVSGNASPGSILHTAPTASASELLSGGAFGLEGSIFTTVVALVLCVVAYRAWRTKQATATS